MSPLPRHSRPFLLGLHLGIALACSMLLPGPHLALHAQDADRIKLAVEALNRLENVDLDSNPRLKETLYKVLASINGTPDYVRLVGRFNLRDQTEGLLNVAAQAPAHEASVEAARLLLAQEQIPALQTRLRGTNEPAITGLVQALGGTRDARVIPLLHPLLTDPSQPVAVRKQAVRALVRTQEGAETVLRDAQAGSLPEELRFTAGQELAAVRWPRLREQAQNVFPQPQARNAQPLPPVTELLKNRGDAARGQAIFTSEMARCSTCHRVGATGIQVGPDLTQIGSKLGKDALYEAILDPSAAISFGFEAWELVLKSNDEAFGIIVSETETDLALKDTQGLVTRYQRADIQERRKMKLSIMPADLQQTMSAQDLVDLVEFLSSLREESKN